MPRSLLILFLMTAQFVGLAQDKPNPNEYVEEKPVLMRQEATGGLNIHSAGWGIQFRRAQNITVSRKRLYEADFVGIKHPKEVKSVNQAFERARSYVYGKLNTFSVLRAGTGMQHVIFSKAERNGIEVRLSYSGGISAGILKPVYLNILEPTGTFGEFRVITERYDPERHFVDNIYERAPFTEGLGQIRFRPGAYAKIGFNFEYATAFEDVKALEIGAIIDAFPKEIPIMAYAKNEPVFLTFYITFMYGRKW
ncbi:MAG: hypothetical protein LW707_09925 [Sphingobacteriales bacterium]|jgi:hypothetical protein|nr:hypothetical protein [Sphingobacteriales bacterium]